MPRGRVHLILTRMGTSGAPRKSNPEMDVVKVRKSNPMNIPNLKKLIILTIQRLVEWQRGRRACLVTLDLKLCLGREGEEEKVRRL